MYIATTTPKVLSPKALNNRDRCSAVTAETSALNCSANSATTASTSDTGSDAGSETDTSTGSGGNDIVCAQTRRTRPTRRPSGNARETNRVS